MPPCQDDTVDHSFHTLTAHKGLWTAAVWLLLVQASCLYKKLGRPNSQSRNYQISSHLSIRSLKQLSFQLTTQKGAPIWLGTELLFCRQTDLWIVLPRPLDSTFQALPASICHADCPQSCRIHTWKQSEHISPRVPQGQAGGPRGSSITKF